MIDLPVGAVLLFIGTVTPDGFKIVACPWEQMRHEPLYVDNMPRLYAGPDFKPNPNFIEYRCITKDGK